MVKVFFRNLFVMAGKLTWFLMSGLGMLVLMILILILLPVFGQAYFNFVDDYVKACHAVMDSFDEI